MFRKITATLLLLAFVAQTFSAPFIRLDYYFNQADYAKNCINKSRPKMHCNGKCQMMKKILAEEKKDQEQAERKMGSKVEVLSSSSFFCSIIIHSIVVQNTYCTKGVTAPIDRPYSVFHPPKV